MRRVCDPPNHVGGDVDLVWNSRPTEIKTSTSFGTRALSRPLKSHQSDLHLISLNHPINREPRARRLLNDWLDRNPDNEVWILHRYDHERLDGPYNHNRRP